MNKKNLTQKLAIALLCAASLPVNVSAEMHSTLDQPFFAGGSCGANNDDDDKDDNSGSHSSCAASDGTQATTNVTKPAAHHSAASAGTIKHESAGMSSYSGTSTGPGVNGGYPGTPSGSYPASYEAAPNRNATNQANK